MVAVHVEERAAKPKVTDDGRELHTGPTEDRHPRPVIVQAGDSDALEQEALLGLGARQTSALHTASLHAAVRMSCALEHLARVLERPGVPCDGVGEHDPCVMRLGLRLTRRSARRKAPTKPSDTSTSASASSSVVN